jgi:hypothetical protein
LEERRSRASPFHSERFFEVNGKVHDPRPDRSSRDAHRGVGRLRSKPGRVGRSRTGGKREAVPKLPPRRDHPTRRNSMPCIKPRSASISRTIRPRSSLLLRATMPQSRWEFPYRSRCISFRSRTQSSPTCRRRPSIFISAGVRRSSSPMSIHVSSSRSFPTSRSSEVASRRPFGLGFCVARGCSGTSGMLRCMLSKPFEPRP